MFFTYIFWSIIFSDKLKLIGRDKCLTIVDKIDFHEPLKAFIYRQNILQTLINALSMRWIFLSIIINIFSILKVSTETGSVSHFYNLHIVIPRAYILGADEYYAKPGGDIALVCIIEDVSRAF